MGCIQMSAQKRFKAASDLTVARLRLKQTADQYADSPGTMGVIINRSPYTLREIQIHNGCGEMVVAPPEKI
eukprot:CAMPEP_0197036702 /NCGR_PEP_ID=MMETSP1384-20130603/14130_1 /TAXON_ID=29189 /ORGANISM="Ammonia sp." /LENGTH=70 /DNA_ID=CAMNT_0042466903 /DNA_START=83 /DNA_END=292 /DNA_ORIENTATION=+